MVQRKLDERAQLVRTFDHVLVEIPLPLVGKGYLMTGGMRSLTQSKRSITAERRPGKIR